MWSAPRWLIFSFMLFSFRRGAEIVGRFIRFSEDSKLWDAKRQIIIDWKKSFRGGLLMWRWNLWSCMLCLETANPNLLNPPLASTFFIMSDFLCSLSILKFFFCWQLLHPLNKSHAFSKERAIDRWFSFIVVQVCIDYDHFKFLLNTWGISN